MRKSDQLHKYQVDAIKRMIAEPELALFMDLGLGKTACSLFAAKHLIRSGKVRNVLIVAPIRVVYSTWRQEAKEWAYTRDLSFTVLHGPNKDGRLLLKRDIYLTNYESIDWLTKKIRKHIAQHKSFPFDMVIYDESSKLKSPKTKRFKALKGLVKNFKRKYLLTATPVPNSLMEIWSQFFILDGGKTLGTAFGSFQRRYFYEARKYVWQPFDHTRSEIQRAIAPKTIRLKASDYLQLPEISYNEIRLSLPDRIKEQYKELEDEYFLELEDGSVEALNAAALSIKLRQVIQGAAYTSGGNGAYSRIHDVKLDALKDVVETLGGQPVIIPIQFRFEKEILLAQKDFKDAKIIAGGTNPTDAQRYIDDWNKGNLQVLFCHPASISHGVNLQAGGHNMLWYSLTWSLEQYQQLVGRLYRQGQKHHVIVHHLVMEQTVDMAVLQAIKNKAENQNALLEALREYRKGQRQ